MRFWEGLTVAAVGAVAGVGAIATYVTIIGPYQEAEQERKRLAQQTRDENRALREAREFRENYWAERDAGRKTLARLQGRAKDPSFGMGILSP